MSCNSETAEDIKRTKGPLAAVSDGACTVECTEIVPLDKASDDYQAHLVVHVQPDNLLDVKQEPADDNDNEDANYPIKQELADDYETERPCFTMQVSSLMFS